MSVTSWFTDLCDIERNTVTINAGGSEEPGWNSLATSVRCRLQQSAESESSKDTAKALRTWFLLLPYGQDVTARDKITTVTRSGTTMLTEHEVTSFEPDPGNQQEYSKAILYGVE